MPRIIQFGEGVFLRAFVDSIFQELSDAGFPLQVTLAQPRSGDAVARLMAAGGRWTVLREGLDGGQARRSRLLIDVVDSGLSTHENPDDYAALAVDPSVRLLVSNTTEAGISWNEDDAARRGDLTTLTSFPAKVTWMLRERMRAGIQETLHILPCELIADNGMMLRELVLRMAAAWCEQDEYRQFEGWLASCVSFHNTLVDQIVVGGPRETVLLDGQADPYAVQCEWFRLWHIDGDASLLDVLPLELLGPAVGDIALVESVAPIRETKVRVLNGLHTVMASVGPMYGCKTVAEAISHPQLGAWLREDVQDEICAVMDDADGGVSRFARSVWDRFANPSIEHSLASILTNTSAKIPARLGGTIADRAARGLASPALGHAVAAWLSQVHQGWVSQDDADILKGLTQVWNEDDWEETARRSLTILGQACGHQWPGSFVMDVAKGLATANPPWR